MFQGFLKDVTGNYITSFIVAGGFLILSTLTFATLPHYFSWTDPPPPQRCSRHDDKDMGLNSELEQMNSLSSAWFIEDFRDDLVK